MCGICGIFDLGRKKGVYDWVIKRMMGTFFYRGPDDMGSYQNRTVGLGFTRLSIIDPEGGKQPLSNEDGSIILVCNGEIFNYIELRKELINKGHIFKTRTDVEVLLHLYEDKGTDFLNLLNGQFAFALYDSRKDQLFCARDHFGIAPFFYTIVDEWFIFASEIKGILEHPAVRKEVDLVGLDQIFSFPGLIAPRTMFKHILSLENGHYLVIKDPDNIKKVEYWDMVYPEMNESNNSETKSEAYYIETLDELLIKSIYFRLRSDVPVGFYISGGLDSSLISARTHELTPGIRRYSFSIDFEEKVKSESRYQRIMADYLNSIHTEKMFLYQDISERLEKVVYHSEQPLKETYNTASLALSEAVRKKNIKVVLSGEGADEWFAGYPGYKFDKFNIKQKNKISRDKRFERALNYEIWGDENFNYEMNQYQFTKIKKELYSVGINEIFEDIDSLRSKIVNKDRLKNRDILHKRSYLDYKLRLVGHLIADHGDRMAYANSVEVRYPFLDKDLVEFAALIPPQLKLREFDEKYILKMIAQNVVPQEIVKREKFAFHSPGSPYLLKRNIEYINDLLSYETIKKQGYFNSQQVEKLKKIYNSEGFRLNIPYESDLLIVVITFGIFLEVFQLPDFK